MKALSLRQPWANAVLHLGKTIENRRWNTSFRGEFLIHAATGMTDDEYDDAKSFCRDVLGGDAATAFKILEAFGEPPVTHPLKRGFLVGIARLVRVIPPCSSEPSLFYRPCEHPWHMPGQYGFVLEDVREIPAMPFKGWPGFFDVPDLLVEELRAIGRSVPRSP